MIIMDKFGLIVFAVGCVVSSLTVTGGWLFTLFLVTCVLTWYGVTNIYHICVCVCVCACMRACACVCV